MQAVDIPPKYILVATRMFNSGKRMNKLINYLIDFTRTHLGPGIPIRVKQSSPIAAFEEVVNEARTFHPERSIHLQVPPNLDAIFDDGRLAQALSNLIGNAIQYSRAEFSVTVRLSADVDNFSISVNNRGDVIPPDKIASIFDPMVRIAAHVNQNNADYIECTSRGIGLYISREIVHAHGGHISVTSNIVDGTTFALTIPKLPIGFLSSDVAHHDVLQTKHSWSKI